MAGSAIVSFIAACALFSFASELALASPQPQSVTDTLLSDSATPSGWTWFWISGDGSQVLPISGPLEIPKNLTLTSSDGFVGGPYSGDSYTYGFGNLHGPAHAQPALAKFLFECEFGLFGQVPARAPGVWTPYPNSQYGCYGNPGVLRMEKLEQSTGWLMAYHDIAFLIKVLHDTQGVMAEAPWFNFQIGWSNKTGVYDHVPVVDGKWDQTYNDAAVSTS